ncbi:MAG: c-type cytochrome [Chloroflexi bacterium]|nr:c-type cytochrome [Chloroflexota bacterium]
MTTPSPLQRPVPSKSRKQLYKEQYEAAKREGEAFFPYTVFKDAIVALTVIAGLVLMAVVFRVPTEPIADPTSTTYNPRPEWYFLFLFEMLKFFPGYLEPVAATVIPGLAVVVLLLLPFLDRKWNVRHPLDRPITTGITIVAMLVIGYLTFRGAVAPLVSPGAVESPAVAEGRRLYGNLNCSYCHSINGIGGAVGPDLGVASRGLSQNTIEQYLQNPHAMVPQSLHPKLQFTPDELNALSAYVASIGAVPVFTENAPKIFQQYCSSCHTIDGSGGKVGPDLSRVGTFRTQAYLKSFISDPKSVFPGSTMPGFGTILSDADLNDVAAYLASMRGPSPAPTPTPTAAPTPTVAPSPTPKQSPSGSQISYSRDVQPIFERYCNTCHGAAAMGGLSLANYQTLMSTGSHKPIVVAGQSDQSLLHQVLSGPAQGVSQMPPGSPLSPDIIKTMGDWIDQGAQNN